MSKVLVLGNLGKDFIIDPLTKCVNIDRSKEVTQAKMEQAINDSIATLIGGAPDGMKTLKDISDEVEKIKSATSRSAADSGDNAELKGKLKVISDKLDQIERLSPFIIAEGRPDRRPDMSNKPVGSLYRDSNNTDGASIWIKKSNGWSVILGDTGWLRLGRVVSIKDPCYVDIRRIGDLIQFAFGGGSWGFFGIKGRTEDGFVNHGAFDRNKGCKIVDINGIPEGFKLSASFAGTIFKDYKEIYGTYYVGGSSDSNFMAIGFNIEIPEEGGINDIRFSPVNGATTDRWPDLEDLRSKGLIR